MEKAYTHSRWRVNINIKYFVEGFQISLNPDKPDVMKTYSIEPDAIPVPVYKSFIIY